MHNTHDPNEPTATSKREKGIDKYANAQRTNEIAIEFSRKRENEHYISRTFVRLILFDYKRLRQSRRQSASSKNSVSLM